MGDGIRERFELLVRQQRGFDGLDVRDVRILTQKIHLAHGVGTPETQAST
jgi:hypothetical protein